MPRLDKQYEGWQKSAKHTLPNPTNTNTNNQYSPTPCYGYIPVKTTEYNQYINIINGNIVRKPNLFKTYALI